ncbi:hypothetical protein AYO21_05608 [Fonsecaea monophora]|uniref:Major facilitator superfamily (MFS) profile domain-containing protein n=1 Tax=Fonsecaea monophora TaxID=254056 RepID=A0A177F945_9EURO|nr:hypothetical protein AYO21_05608 [Fonsecaea monophora]OAG40130.1 hypothetical protein AYO21_05608 [Fonsecaea monophora]
MKRLALHEIEHSHGTVQLISGATALQHKKGTSIVLVPQPSQNDPNDPLNWPFTKRVTAFWSVLWLSGLCNFCITGLAPGFGQIIAEFNVTLTQVTWLISACLLGEFMGCYTVAPFSTRYGKRPIWLLTSVVFFVCNIWASVAKSYPSLLLARFFASWAAGTSEPLSVDTLHDLFYLHERGTQAGVQTIWLSWGSSLAPVICGYLIQAKGWRWFHWLTSIMAGVDLILIFLFVPETQYHRDLHKALDSVGIEGNEEMELDAQKASPSGLMTMTKSEDETTTEMVETQNPAPEKRTFLQELKPWSPVQKDVNVVASFLRPWATWCYPSVLWGVFSFSIHVTCVVVLITMIPVYFGAPPYNFSIGQQGLVYLSSCIGNAFGSIFCGFLNDKLSQWSTRRNHGVFEPEMRLPVTVFPAFLVPAGLLMFGVGIEHGTHWIVPVIGVGLVGVALTGIGSVIQPYLMDSYTPVLFDCLVTFNGFKNLVSFAVGFAVVPWLQANGLVAVFCILAALVFVIDASVVVIYMYGKRLRQRDSRLKVFHF